ncbi:MAG: MBL fold metallo-hydrolase [Thermoanaerobacteraceae bacterium]|nr:MBL fold metallo-hydrolase [Thermoanaerobacteraceae bacterium]
MDKSFPFELAAGLYVLGNRHFFSFLVTGETHALIEMGVSATAPLVAGQLAALGVDPQKVAYLVVPHAHFDHLGGLPYHRSLFSRAQVVCSDRALETMAKTRVLEQFFREDAFTSAWLEEAGKGRRTFSWLPGSVLEAGMVVSEGDLLTLGRNSTLQFMAAPGHSPCSLAVYLPERETLLVSDSLGFFLGPGDNFPLFFYDYDAYLKTVCRLGRVGAATVAAAHEFIFTGDDAAGCFKVAEETARKFCRHVRTFQGSGEELAAALYDRYYRGGLQVYSPQNIKTCVELLVRRAQGARQGADR